MNKVNISEAELVIMKALWKSDGPLTSYDISDRLQGKEWKYTTVSTLLSRLVEKGAVTYEKKGKTYFYVPILKQEDYRIKQTKHLIGKIYDGSVKNLIASLFANEEICEEDIKEIKEMFKLY